MRPTREPRSDLDPSCAPRAAGALATTSSEVTRRGAAVAGVARPKPRLAYLVNVFPSFIETMIYREVGALRSMGYEILPFAVRRPEPGDLPPEARQLVDGTTYILPMSLPRLAAAHLRAMLRWPLRYWTTLLACVAGGHGQLRHRLRTVGHFVWAIAALPAIEQARVDHIHAHWATGPATAAMIAARLLGIPFSFTAHAYDVWREQLLLGEKLRAASSCVTCTEYNRRHLATTYGVPAEKIVTVHHGVDVRRFGAMSRTSKAEPLIVSVGRMVEQKGFDGLIRVCRRLAEAGERFRCEIIGEGPLRPQLQELIDRHGLGDRVVLPGKLHQEELLQRYAAADLFVLLCRRAGDDDRDGIPNVLIEAMATELPVVSTSFSGVPELVVGGETGLLLEPDDEDGQVDAVRTLLRDPDLRARMGRAGRHRVMEGFTTEASAARLDGLFVRLVPPR